MIAATVLLMTALSVMFRFLEQGGSFGQWANSTQQDTSCDLSQTQSENARQCTPPIQTNEATEIREEAESNSGTWTESYSCQQLN